MFKASIISLFIRGFSILSRFTLFIYIGKFLPTSEYGIFGLLQSSLAIGVYLIGLDLYVYTNREIPKMDFKGVQAVVQSQFAVHIMAYIIFLPLITLILSDTFIPSKYIGWFCILLMLEHITFEFIRILIALQHPLYANLIISLRSLLWILLFLVITYTYPSVLSIKNLLLFWISGLAISLIISICLFFKLKILPFETWKIDTEFIKQALKGSFIFLMASISQNTIEFSNRYFLKYYYSSFEVGVYSFFQNIVNLMDVFIYTALIMIILPKLIEAKSRGDDLTYKNKLDIMQGGIFYGTIFLAIALFFIINPFLSFIGKEEMVKNIEIFRMLLLGSALFCLSHIGHYVLYINNNERLILAASLVGTVINIILNIILIPTYGMTGAAISTIGSISVMGGLKIYFSHLITPVRFKIILIYPLNFFFR